VVRTFRYQLRSRPPLGTVDQYREAARRAVPDMVWAYIENGAEDERTLRANREAFLRWNARQRVLVGHAEVDLRTTVAGVELDLPVLLAPVGLTGLAHWHGEVGAARAAERAGTRAVVSTVASYSIEEIGDGTDEDHWFQLYVFGGRPLAQSLLEAAEAAGMPVLFLTVDVPVLGNRIGEIRRGMGRPPVLTPRRILDAAVRPRWWYHLLRDRRASARNFVGGGGARDAVRSVDIFARAIRAEVDWDDLAWMRERWTGRLYVKGVLEPDDAARAVDLGADGVVVSNHGGRQLNGAPASLDSLPAVVDRVGDHAEVLFDGGVRTGADVITALALGARACLVGRAFVYGLAVGGERGVLDVLRILKDEMTRNMLLMGCRSVKDLDRSSLVAAPPASPWMIEQGYALRPRRR
jgi:L-lactate dehydrogenase (cytochrome)/(S)-mandelate dehydrogenase